MKDSQGTTGSADTGSIQTSLQVSLGNFSLSIKAVGLHMLKLVQWTKKSEFHVLNISCYGFYEYSCFDKTTFFFTAPDCRHWIDPLKSWRRISTHWWVKLASSPTQWRNCPRLWRSWSISLLHLTRTTEKWLMVGKIIILNFLWIFLSMIFSKSVFPFDVSV